MRVADDEERKPAFYSNAQKAVEGISQKKASGDQWLAMIQKAGGLKAGEDKWLGLSDWLNERKGKPVTKDEVMNFIRENQVQIEEVNYSENSLPKSMLHIEEIWKASRCSEWKSMMKKPPKKTFRLRKNRIFAIREGQGSGEQTTGDIDRHRTLERRA